MNANDRRACDDPALGGSELHFLGIADACVGRVVRMDLQEWLVEARLPRPTATSDEFRWRSWRRGTSTQTGGRSHRFDLRQLPDERRRSETPAGQVVIEREGSRGGS